VTFFVLRCRRWLSANAALATERGSATIFVVGFALMLFACAGLAIDGGRAINAFASSFSSNLGVAVGVLGLAGAVALATWMGFSLIWLIAFMGAVELVAEARARSGGRALRLLPEPARFGPVHYRHFRAALGPPSRDTDELLLARDLARMEQAARVEPMSRRQIVGWGLLYAGLAAALLAIVYFTSHLPGAAEAAGVLI